uniref:CCDC174 alpha/beta GRSR domain-containing protein n=1 Tax=Timema shepardi TaxID=629360 RepID=A0A7R9B4X9_TIMSH|nr:unnamed protein product [Timema shepardi]
MSPLLFVECTELTLVDGELTNPLTDSGITDSWIGQTCLAGRKWPVGYEFANSGGTKRLSCVDDGDIGVVTALLVSLKAELVRKQAEVHKAKSEAKAHFIHPLPHPKKETVFNKKNKGVGGREERDAEEIKEDEDMHKKSRDLDPWLECSSEIADEDKRFLVNFEQKATESRDAAHTSTSNQEGGVSDGEDEERHFSDEYDAPSDPEDDWVEYTDVLGRTRKALRRDLPFLKEKDAKLADSLGYGKDTEELRAVPSEVTTRDEVQGETLEMMSSDMKREMMRQKWEEQEVILRDKADIHYQDVLFDGWKSEDAKENVGNEMCMKKTTREAEKEMGGTDSKKCSSERRRMEEIKVGVVSSTAEDGEIEVRISVG